MRRNSMNTRTKSNNAECFASTRREEYEPARRPDTAWGRGQCGVWVRSSEHLLRSLFGSWGEHERNLSLIHKTRSMTGSVSLFACSSPFPLPHSLYFSDPLPFCFFLHLNFHVFSLICPPFPLSLSLRSFSFSIHLFISTFSLFCSSSSLFLLFFMLCSFFCLFSFVFLCFSVLSPLFVVPLFFSLFHCSSAAFIYNSFSFFLLFHVLFYFLSRFFSFLPSTNYYHTSSFSLSYSLFSSLPLSHSLFLSSFPIL